MSAVASNPSPSAAGQRSGSGFRWFLALLAFLALLYALLQIKQLVHNYSVRLSGNAVIEPVPYTEPVKAAIAQKLEGAKGVFQLTLLLLAALWGLVIAKKDERILLFSKRHLPELIMFAIANMLFGASAYCYTAYTDAMASVHTAGGGAIPYGAAEDLTIMDFRESRINDIYVWQVRIWAAGLAVVGLTLLSAHGLLEGNKKDTQACDAPPTSPSSLQPSQS